MMMYVVSSPTFCDYDEMETVVDSTLVSINMQSNSNYIWIIICILSIYFLTFIYKSFYLIMLRYIVLAIALAFYGYSISHLLEQISTVSYI